MEVAPGEDPGSVEGILKAAKEGATNVEYCEYLQLANGKPKSKDGKSNHLGSGIFF
jgi:hypothetical protein